MAVRCSRLSRGAVDVDRVNRVRPVRVEVHRERRRRVGEIERDRLATRERGPAIGRNGQRDVVPEARNPCRSIDGEPLAGSHFRIGRCPCGLGRERSTR
jgi:hypothetical protein